MVELDTSKYYEWFLQEIKAVSRNGGSKIKLTWNCVSEDHTITEWCGVAPDGTYGPRLLEFSNRLGMASPHDFRKGMHIWAKVQRHWTQEKNEAIEFEFCYESISPRVPGDQAIDSASRKRLEFLCRQASTWEDARANVKAKAPGLLSAFEQLRLAGELQLAGGV